MNPSIEPLFSPEPATRRAALEGIDLVSASAAYALREVLLSDEDASLRAAAAVRLGEPLASAVARSLVDALYDTHPSVRAAACRSLAKQRYGAATPLLARLAQEEPIWWVRRVAVLAFARLEREAALPVLSTVLDDPFWRVRHAAVRALIAIGARVDHDSLLDTLREGASSERAVGALRYLERRLRAVSGNDPPSVTSELAMTSALAAGPLADPDPAVIAARVERGAPATTAELALYLGDPHERLREAVSERLLRANDVRALLTGALWLEEPRIPHATATVIALLDRLPATVLEAVLDGALAEPEARPGAALWALSCIEGSSRWERIEAVLSGVHSSRVLVRRQAIAALAPFLLETAADVDLEAEQRRARAALRSALGDVDPDVHRLAVHGLVRIGDVEALATLTFDDEPVLVQRLLVALAVEKADTPVLERAARSEDPETQARAVAALKRTHPFPELRRSPDPWIRSALVDRAHALAVLEGDPDLHVRRQAFVTALRVPELATAAARLAVEDPDVDLRVRATEHLVRSEHEEDLVRVLHRQRDPDAAVRAAAADLLVVGRDVERRLSGVRASYGADPAIAEAVDLWLGHRVPVLLAQAHDDTRPRLPRTPSSRNVVEPASPRPLGATGLVLSPLVVSGAHEPSISALHEARDAGSNVFFWEPRHRNLSVFLKEERRGQRSLVVAGTYHATARAIREDVLVACKRLRRERIDVFLVFWTRSDRRLEGEVAEELLRLREKGHIGAAGFSTHDRELARRAIGQPPWQVAMLRHSAVHPGAERRALDGASLAAIERGKTLFEHAASHGVGVLSFSATSYGRMLRRTEACEPPSAAECYRYSLSQPGVTACVTAPRGGRQLRENLEVLREPTLASPRCDALREHGRILHEESRDFGRYLRRFPALPPASTTSDPDAIDELLEEAMAPAHLADS